VKYTKTFDVEKTKVPASLAATRTAHADRSDGAVYLYTPEIELTVNVALATGRPVLLRGPSGSGKSSLARNVALRMGWRFYEEVITSNTQHTDLLYRYDLLRRFRDANDQQGAGLRHDAQYLEPRALWWAFDRDSALVRGLKANETGADAAVDPSPTGSADKPAVVLIDEIDKADPDVPNNLLVALGSLRFAVPYLKDVTVITKKERAPLVLITSNNERDLPTAFLRRCVVLELRSPDPGRMIEIAASHFGHEPHQITLYRAVAALAFPMPETMAAGTAGAPRERRTGDSPASTAEYLDAVKACLTLGVNPAAEDDTWNAISSATLRKASQDDRAAR
jgi:MoxR-like ATPase